MKREKISNEKLDAIGTMLLESGKLTTVDIDAITNRPDLFARIRRGINEQENIPTVVQRQKSMWALGTVLVPALSMILIAAAVYATFLTGRPVGTALPAPSTPPAVALEQGPVQAGVTGQFTVARHKPDAVRVVRTSQPVRRQKREVDDMSGFYALTYDNDDDMDMRLIRADLPRSSLIAMGLNVHLESGNDKVKTDLLVGSDGVPRAIRIVK